ncbi:HlyD family secretion protein [Vibrio rarus]|uniref:HlyD family secretion protein n=1 Tax=Vibrio rarus TaxID=413403 RepID=UPI0021C41334|nr:biotin/lipoyl-binding protein [Vibrio rarus]
MSTKTPIAVAVLALVALVGYGFYQAYQPQPIRIQGQMTAQQYSISSKVAGRIDTINVKKGDKIHKGEQIFTIYSPEIDAKLEQARAGQEAAGAMAEQAENGARTQQISAAHDQWRKAKAASSLMEKTYRRVNHLYKDGVVAEQKRDEAYTQWQAAKYTENAAYQMYLLAKEGARSETKKAASEKVRMAAGAVAEVEAYAADTQIESRFDGEVSQVLLHSGELAPQGFPVVTVIDTLDSWAVFNVREDLLKHFAKDSEISAFVPALDDEVRFRITHVAVMGDFATWRATDSTQGFDLRTFEVEARPLDHQGEFRIGMSVVLTLDEQE